MIKPILGSVMALALMSSVSVAQNVQTATQADVVAACAAEGTSTANCTTVLQAYIAGLRASGASAATVNAAVGDLVAALASVDGLSPAAQAVAVAAIRESATFSSDPQQVAQINDIANTVASGDAEGTAAIEEVPSSPA